MLGRRVHVRLEQYTRAARIGARVQRVRVRERDTSATRDSCYLRRRATHASRLEAAIRGQVHAG